ncbi:MAG: hypothetical protein IJP89_10860 [Synergistaceae bacterium]|nr:hypothetical protein [Synergistaceae bacterium]
MKKTALGVMLVMILSAFFACGAFAAEDTKADGGFDFLTFAKERVLPDFHPTVKPEEAESNYVEEPFYKGDGVIRAKVGIFYKGWIQQHSMELEIDLRTEDRKVRVNVIKDTNKMNLAGARFFKDGEWVSLASVGWK